jgi:hypothetical protein
VNIRCNAAAVDALFAKRVAACVAFALQSLRHRGFRIVQAMRSVTTIGLR